MLCLGLSLWFLRLQDALQQKPLGNFEEQNLLLTGPAEYAPKPHSEVEEERHCGPGVLHLLESEA